MKKRGFGRVLRSLHHYLIFFLMIAFFITSSLMLFVETMTRTTGINLTEENISGAAKLTFLNVILLSLICTVIDWVRRRLTVDRPVQRITRAAERIIQGDYTVRIPKTDVLTPEGGFDQIIDCFNKMAEELSGTETLRTDFIANVSHELKTPLAVMNNYGTLLQQPDLSEAQRIEYAKAVTDSSRRLAALVTNILKLNKLENQQIFPAAREYDLSEQLCECLLGFEEVWERKGIDLVTEISDGVAIASDPELLELVWNNLLSNAFKFTEEGGSVTVALSADERYATVRVSDTGCGMSAEVGAHIFEKFYQGDASHATQGNGLGLALVKRVADILKGEISVSSAVGRGTEFTVRIRRNTGDAT